MLKGLNGDFQSQASYSQQAAIAIEEAQEEEKFFKLVEKEAAECAKLKAVIQEVLAELQAVMGQGDNPSPSSLQTLLSLIEGALPILHQMEQTEQNVIKVFNGLMKNETASPFSQVGSPNFDLLAKENLKRMEKLKKLLQQMASLVSDLFKPQVADKTNKLKQLAQLMRECSATQREDRSPFTPL